MNGISVSAVLMIICEARRGNIMQGNIVLLHHSERMSNCLRPHNFESALDGKKR